MAVMALSACEEKAPPQMKPLDFAQAKTVSDVIANDLLQNDVKDLYKHLDVGFQMMVKDDKDVAKVLEKMYAESGRPLEFDFKISKTGIRKDGSWERPSRTFWYAARTSLFDKGKYFLKVEIVPAYGGNPLNTSGFGLLYFKDKVPSYLQ
jgi:hypothetical protein